eukprot:Ihof_evm4s648 gene=Ihof_evmTU4s648
MFQKFAFIACLLALYAEAYVVTFKQEATSGATNLKYGVTMKQLRYLAEVEIGAQTFDLMIDTTTTNTLVIGNSCKAYEKTNDCSNLAIPSGVRCNFEKNAESRYNTDHGKNLTTIIYKCDRFGNLVDYTNYQDDMKVAGILAPKQVFGVIYAQPLQMYGFNTAAADGVLGLGPNVDDHSVISTMASESGMRRVFSLCFELSGNGGKMVMGGGELKDMTMIPYQGVHRYYLPVASMSIGGQTISAAVSESAIIDTASYKMILPSNVYQAVINALCAALDEHTVGGCINSPEFGPTPPEYIIAPSPDLFTKLPVISISFVDGEVIQVRPEEYYQKTAYENDEGFVYYFLIEMQSFQFRL